MKLSINWLKQFVNIDDWKIEDIADKLTNSGFEVENIKPASSATKVVVGFVKDCQPHPDSDHLSVCQVDCGNEVLQICCGAANVASGQKVVVALDGAVLSNISIKETTIRGVKSQGMICSLSELGVDKKQQTAQQLAGIEVLPQDAEIGSDPLVILGLDDVVLDVAIMPDRVDCNAMFAMALEIGAILDKPVKLPEIPLIKEEKTALRIYSTTEKCPLFIGKILRGLTIKESPQWIKSILHSQGIKSINNIVDISNLVMLETGQPLHFYDLDKLPKSELGCEAGYQGSYIALDDISYDLLPEDLVIKSDNQVMAIAGIMGGSDTRISENTKNILIESANFNQACVRVTSRRINLPTEAAQRFSRGVSYYSTDLAVKRATALLLRYGAANTIEESVIYGNLQPGAKIVDLSVAHCNALLNTDFSSQQIAEVFRRLACDFNLKDEVFSVVVPPYRSDIASAEDLIEEVVRIIGYQYVNSKLPTLSTTVGKKERDLQLRNSIKTELCALGLSEIITYSLVGSKQLAEACLPWGAALTLSNPLSEERKYYRNSLLPSMLETIAYNRARFNERCAFFEIAAVYDEKATKQERLCLATCGELSLSSWQKKTQSDDFYSLKGKIATLLAKMGFDNRRIYYQKNTQATTSFHPKLSAAIFVDKTFIGVFGLLHPRTAKNYDISSGVAGEINLSALYQLNPGKLKYQAVSKFPALKFDLAVIIAEEIPAKQLLDCVSKYGKAWLSDVEIFDVYTGSNIEVGKKSLALRLVFQATDKTLEDQDIAALIKDISTGIKQDLQGEIREK